MTDRAFKRFLESKSVYVRPSGFNPGPISSKMFDFQRDTVRWGLRKGKCAFFQDCGLGKTFQELEFGRHVVEHTGRPVIDFMPHSVATQTRGEGEKFDIPVKVCREQSDVHRGVNVTNYEMLRHFDPREFAGIIVDESSILKGDGPMRKAITEFASHIPYRLACSATPAPNDHVELGNHAEFLGIMSKSEMLATFFIHDGGDTSKWRLKGHAGDLIAVHDRCINCGKPRQSESDDSHGCKQYQGMIFHSEVCIWKDPVTAMHRTKAIGLLYKQLRKDSCLSRQGIPDYLVTMRKPGENPERVTKTHEGFPVDKWQNYASPVWMDINPSDTLQRESAREDDDERHICPLQLQVIERGIELWTNPRDIVLSPFAGIGSEGYVSVKAGRRFIGVELKESYYKQACINIGNAENEGTQASLLAGLDETEVESAH